MSMLEQMVETRAWKEVRQLSENSQCRLCKEQQREREREREIERESNFS